MKKILIVLLRTYQVCFSRLFPAHCRFYPSCSEYAIHVLQRKGIIIGLSRALWRVLRCNPYSKGGYDPVD